MQDGIEISVIVPVFNEEESLPPLYEALKRELDALGKTYELVFCDDGSKDRSLAILKEWAAKDPAVKVVAFRRNFGQTAAMDAGFKFASGRVLVPIDADLQNDPKDIGRLLAKMEEGYDVVKGWREKRKDTYLTKTLPSRIANRLISRITEVPLHDYGCTLTAYKREIMQEVNLYGEMHRFIPVYAHWAGGRVTEIPVTHHPRRFGTSKYTLRKTFRVILDLMTVRLLLGYSTKPLYFFGRFAFFAFAIAFFGGLVALAKKAFGGPGFWGGDPLYTDPFFYMVVFFGVVGFQIILIGLLAELHVRTYFESQNRQPFTVRETLNMGGRPPLPSGPRLSTDAPRG
jgi:glycosyltransferase involved in cell wall biosynthesis